MVFFAYLGIIIEPKVFGPSAAHGFTLRAYFLDFV